MSAKESRQSALLDLIDEEQIGTQTELVRRLSSRGIACTQASVSRDIRELGLVKQDGRYVAQTGVRLTPEAEGLASSVGGFLGSVEPVGENLVVVKCLSGTADSVALFLDAAKWPGVAGTVAGDDTVFVAVRNRAAGRSLRRSLLSVGRREPVGSS